MKQFNTEVLIKLGELLKKNGIPKEIISCAISKNNWFTEESIKNALNVLIDSVLSHEKLEQWLSKYKFKDIKNTNLGIIMAGNIPFVGFMDMIYGVVLGVNIYIKPSTKDSALIIWITKQLNELGVDIKELENNSIIDILIATGSNNATRYFEQKYPNTKKILRNSRASVSIIDNNTSSKDIQNLWHDCFDYFGLGCRNVSHLLLPKDFNIDQITEIWKKNKITHRDFIGSYTQQKAIMTMTNKPFKDCGSVLMYQSSNLFPAMATISFSYYNTEEELNELLNNNNENIQCIIGSKFISFGKAQSPQLWNYADNVDIINFIYDK